MRKMILFILCAMLFASCERENMQKTIVGEDITISGVCRLQTGDGTPTRISQPALVNMNFNTISVSDYNTVSYNPQHIGMRTEQDGYFGLIADHVVGKINVYAHLEVGDTIQYFSDTTSLETNECENIDIVMNHLQHVFHPNLYDITQNAGIGMYSCAVYPGDSLCFTINHDALTEIRLTIAESTGRYTYKDTCIFATYQTPDTSSFTFVMPDYNPAPNRKLIEYVFGIKFTTLHYGSFNGGRYKAAIIPKD